MDHQPLIHQIRSWYRTRKRYIACVFIALAQCLERISFYGMIGSMEALLTVYPLCWASSDTYTLKYAFNGLTFFTAFLFGYLADAYIQRYYVVILGFLLHLVGIIYFVMLGYYMYMSHILEDIHVDNMQCTSSNNSTKISYTLPLCYHIDGNAECTAPIYVFVTIIALGSSAVRTNLSPFGADQVRSYQTYNWMMHIGMCMAVFLSVEC